MKWTVQIMNVPEKTFGSLLSKYNGILIVGSIILAISVIGYGYSASIVVKDETSHNIAGPSSLPKTHIGPLSMYHVQYGFLFLMIVGFAAVMWGLSGRNEQKTLSFSANSSK